MLVRTCAEASERDARVCEPDPVFQVDLKGILIPACQQLQVTTTDLQNMSKQTSVSPSKSAFKADISHL